MTSIPSMPPSPCAGRGWGAAAAVSLSPGGSRWCRGAPAGLRAGTLRTPALRPGRAAASAASVATRRVPAKSGCSGPGRPCCRGGSGVPRIGPCGCGGAQSVFSHGGRLVSKGSHSAPERAWGSPGSVPAGGFKIKAREDLLLLFWGVAAWWSLLKRCRFFGRLAALRYRGGALSVGWLWSLQLPPKVLW